MSAELRDLAVEVAVEAAGLVRGRRTAGVSVSATKSSDVDIVTDADRASETLIVERLSEHRPDDGFIGEEGSDTPGISGVRWVIDPIDGTVNYFYGLPQYAVSIAAEQDGVVVAGAVVNAATGVVYAAALGQGSTRDGVPVRVRPPPPMHQRLVLTGFGYDVELRAVQATGVGRLVTRVRDIRRLGSCALDLCHVAEGLVDGYVEEGTNLWDRAAGGLVVTEAGGRIEVGVGAGGRDLVVAAPSAGFDEFLALVEEVGLSVPPRE